MAKGIRSLDFTPDGLIARNDIRLDSAGNLAIVEDLAEIQDRVSNSILLHRGEDIWDLTFGIDYARLAELSPIARPLIPAAILAHILARPGVNSAEIIEDNIDSESRVFMITVRIETDVGSILIQT